MYSVLDPALAVEQQRWHDLQRTAQQYRLHRTQSQDPRGRRSTLRRRSVG